MESLCQERLRLTEQLSRAQRGQVEETPVSSGMDELDQFMADNATSLKAETCSKIASKLAEIKHEITRVSNLLSLVAPVNLNTQKAVVVSRPEAVEGKPEETNENVFSSRVQQPAASVVPVGQSSISDTI